MEALPLVGVGVGGCKQLYLVLSGGAQSHRPQISQCVSPLPVRNGRSLNYAVYIITESEIITNIEYLNIL